MSPRPADVMFGLAGYERLNGFEGNDILYADAQFTGATLGLVPGRMQYEQHTGSLPQNRATPALVAVLHFTLLKIV
jgi:hypothetical protein